MCIYIGKDYDELSDRQQRSRKTQIKDHINSHLSQLHKIGLQPLSLKLQSSNQEVFINLNEGIINPRNEVKEDRGKLAPDMLYLLLRYGISQESYHEIAMHCPSLPRLYQVCAITIIRTAHYIE